jgi:hypothetical protein
LGAIIALIWLPARAPSEDFVAQDVQEEKLEEVAAVLASEVV